MGSLIPDTLVPFVVGFLGSLHCVGMCGPLVIACSIRSKTGAPPTGVGALGLAAGAVSHQVFFHAGRIISYGMLGAVVAGFFHSLEVQRFTMQYRGGFMVIAGVLLILLGLVLIRILPVPAVAVRLLTSGGLANRVAGLARSHSLASSAGMGLAAGLMPCGLTWAMLVNAASTLDSGKGFLTMASFGLGTTPLLFLTGLSAFFLSARVRSIGEKAAALAIIGMGLVALAKGGALLCGLVDHCSPIIGIHNEF